MEINWEKRGLNLEEKGVEFTLNLDERDRSVLVSLPPPVSSDNSLTEELDRLHYALLNEKRGVFLVIHKVFLVIIDLTFISHLVSRNG